MYRSYTTLDADGLIICIISADHTRYLMPTVPSVEKKRHVSSNVSGNDSESDGGSSSSSSRISISSSSHVLKTVERREATIDPREGSVEVSPEGRRRHGIALFFQRDTLWR
mmetsp:Transcript_3704/g.5666  ORF Transcript_3704/g.5666 Transcript_3704/m.5666 type:complete len:111 (+) Transcript_3704:97-429(+)